MHYEYYTTTPRIEILKLSNANDLMVIQFEYCPSLQQDGHIPVHRDLDRDFATTLINNVDRDIMINALMEKNIQGIKHVSGHSVKVNTTEIPEQFKNNPWIPPEWPWFTIEVRISFSSEQNAFKSVANHLLDAVHWKNVRTAMMKPGSYCSAN